MLKNTVYFSKKSMLNHNIQLSLTNLFSAVHSLILKASVEYLLHFVLHQESMGSHSCDPRALEIYNILGQY